MNRRRAFKIRDRGPIFTAVVYIVMFIVLLACTLPFLYIIAMSFSSSDAILKGKVSLFPVDFSVEAYRQIFAYPHFFRAYKNTILYTVCGTAISLVLMVLFAYPLSKTRLKGQKFVMKLVVFSMFFSGGMIPNYLLISSLGLTGTVFAMILPFAINQFNLIILVNFFKSIPEELEKRLGLTGSTILEYLYKYYYHIYSCACYMGYILRYSFGTIGSMG